MSVTNRTQTCIRPTQVVDCVTVYLCVGTSVIWRPFYFFVVIVESLLRIFVYRSFCFRCSAVCFGAFCTEGIAIGFNSNSALMCGSQYSLRNRTQRSARYTNGCDEAQHQSQLVWNSQIGSIFASQRSIPHITCTSSRGIDRCEAKMDPICAFQTSWLWCCYSCYSLLQHSRPACLELFVNHTHTHWMNNLRWQSHWFPKMTSLPRRSRDWWRTRDCSLGNLQKIKSIKNLLKHFLSFLFYYIFNFDFILFH